MPSGMGFLPGGTLSIATLGNVGLGTISASGTSTLLDSGVGLEVSADMTITDGADIYIDGNIEGVGERLARIESILGMSSRDRKLEAKYDWLQDIGEDYDNAVLEVAEAVGAALSKISDKYIEAVQECTTMEKLKSNNG